MRNLLRSYLQRIFGKDLSYIFVFFVASCMWANKPAPKPENALRSQQKRVPIQNAAVLQRMSFESAQETGILDLKKNPINGQEVSFKRPSPSEENSLENSTTGKPNNGEQKQSYFQEERVRKEDSPALRQATNSNAVVKPSLQEPSAQASAEIKKPEILEITGNQSRQKPKNREDALIPPPSRSYGKFIISTSPSYLGAKLEEVKQTLSKFGNVKEVREGEMFSLKLSPSSPLQTEEEARNFMEKIIQASFFDVYIEKL